MVILYVAVFAFLVPLQPASAATLSTSRDYLNREIADLASGLQHEVFLTTVGAVSGGAGINKVILVFPDADDGKWCRTAGTDLVATGIANPSGGATETATILPGTLTAACTQGAGASSYDTITVSGVNNLSATTKYGVRIAQAGSPVGLLGTATAAANNIQVTVKTNNGTSDIDTGTVALSLITNDQVSVTATVTPTLTVVLSANTVALGTLATGTVTQGSITSTVTTNASGGYVSQVKYNNTLTSLASDTIADAGGTITNGTAGFGASTSATSQGIATITTACSSGAGTFNASSLTTAFQTFASAAAAVSSDATTLCFLATISGTTPAGSYSSTSTLVTTGRF